MKRFWIKTVNLILIIGMILGYNQLVLYRQKSEEVNSLQAKLTDANTMLKNAENKVNTSQDESQNEMAQNNKTTANYTEQYKDGTYKGQAKGFGGMVAVEVTISRGQIENVNIISADKEDKAYFEMATGVIDEIIESQSADVDAVSGATFSSNGIINAVKQGLEKAEAK